MAWLAFFVSVIAFFAITDLSAKKLNKVALVIVGILMSITAGFRNVGGLGADYNIYMDHYNGSWVYGGYFDGYFEIGYCALVWLCNQLGISYNNFIFLLTSICIFFLLRIIYKRSQCPMFSVMLYMSTYFLFYNMVLLRQMVAVVAFIYCIYYIIDGQLGKFVLTLIFGCLFHYSIIILVFAYFILRYLKINKTTVLLLFALGILMKAIGVENLLSILGGLGGSVLVERTAEYLGESDFSLNPLEYIKMAIFIFLIALKYKTVKDSFEAQVLLKSYLCFCVIILALGHIEVFFRLAMYFDLASLFLIPMLFKKIPMVKSSKVICYLALASFTIFAFLYRSIHFNEGEFFLYKFYFL